MFERTIASWGRLFGRGRAAATEDERRGWARLRCDVETTLHLPGDAGASPVPAWVRDVSPGGVSLVVGRPFEPGAMLSLALPHPDREPPTTVLVCVVHARDLGDGRWQLGGTFSADLTEADLELFAPPTGAARPEQRAWARHPSHAHATYQRVNAPEPGRRPARVLNLSVSGIALEADEPLEVGDLLDLELRDDAGVLVVTTLACVVRVTGGDGGPWLFGCNLLSELTEARLKALV